MHIYSFNVSNVGVRKLSDIKPFENRNNLCGMCMTINGFED